MESPSYLTVLDVVAIHDRILERMAEPLAPLRDADRLEAALARPENAAHYRGADIVEQAAILAVSVSRAQAFVEGNKRTAYFCAIVFLRENGWRFAGPPLEFARRLTALATPTAGTAENAAEFIQWFRTQVSRQ